MELLVVLAVIALGLGMVFVSVGGGWGGRQERRFVLEYAALLRRGSVMAMVQGRPITVTIVPTHREVMLADGRQRLKVPKTVRIEAQGLQSARDGRRYLMFYPDGGSSGGVFQIYRAQTLLAELQIDALTGVVTARRARD